MSSTNEMDVQVENRLSCTWPNVEHRAVTILNAALSGNFRCREMAKSDRFRIFSGRLFQSANVLFRHN